MVRDSQVIEAKNVDIAKQIFLDEVNEKFNDGGDSANDSSMWVQQMLIIANLLILLMKLVCLHLHHQQCF